MDTEQKIIAGLEEGRAGKGWGKGGSEGKRGAKRERWR